VGLLVGAVIGGVVASAVSREMMTATDLVKIVQPVDPNQILTRGMQPADEQAAFVANEVAYLTSPGFADEVAKSSPGGGAHVSVTQDGQSAVVAFKASAPTSDVAREAVDAAVKAYSDHVQKLTTDRVQAALDAVNQAVVDLHDQAVADAARLNEPFDVVVFDDRTRELDGYRVELQAALLRPPGVQVMGSTNGKDAGEHSLRLLGLVGGALLGAMVALTANLLWRSRTRVIASRNQLDRDVSPMPVLEKVVPINERKVADAPTLARTLYSQLPEPRTGVVLVLGASEHSGASAVASLLAAAAREHVEVTVLGVPELKGHKATEVGALLEDAAARGAETIIVDGGSLTSTPQAVDVAALAGLVVVVGRARYDSVSDVETAVNVAEVPTVVVCSR
jgi:hypothetical protein